jgi:SAM-dependent methyltransferase
VPLLEAADSLGAGWRFLIVKCERCGLVFTNPRPDAESIGQFYPADYRCHRSKEPATQPAPNGARLAEYLAPHGRARLLDFGCGAGDFLRQMRALGWNVTGLDISASAVARMDDLPAHVGSLPNPLWTEPCFEAITMRQSLEHVHRPLDVLRAAHRLLTPEGTLLVAVPNFDGFASRWFGPRWYGLDVPRHLTHFTPETLRHLLEVAGFARIEMRQERHNSWIRHSAQHGFLKTRLGAGMAGWWGYVTGHAEGLIATATR